MKRACLLLLAGALVACGDDDGSGGADASAFPDASSDTGLTTDAPSTDTALPDGGPGSDGSASEVDTTADAGSGDATPGDVALTDDAGAGDTTIMDAGLGDAGLGDAGIGDAGQPDAGVPDAGDSGADASGPPAGYHPLVGAQSRLLIGESMQEGKGPNQSGLFVLLTDAPPAAQHDLSYSDGACEFWIAKTLVPCSPECDPFSEYCAPDGTCHAWGNRVSAGTVTFGGLAEPVTAVPDGTAFYGIVPGVLPKDLFTPGAVITAQAPGAEHPAIDLSVTGVGDMILSGSSFLTMVDGQDLTVAWDPQGDGAQVEVAIQIGWHGAPPTHVIWCTAADEDGSLTIPGQMITDFPPAGGIGLFQNPSWIRRVSRQVVEAAGGLLELSVSSEQGLTVEHNAGL